ACVPAWCVVPLTSFLFSLLVVRSWALYLDVSRSSGTYRALHRQLSRHARMFVAMDRALLLLVTVCSLMSWAAAWKVEPEAAAGCDGGVTNGGLKIWHKAAGDDEVHGAYIIKRMTEGGFAELADACGKTPRCNAFDTATGALMTAPLVVVEAAISGGSRETKTSLKTNKNDDNRCEGIFLSNRTLTGLTLPAGENATTLRQKGSEALLSMKAVRVAADKVSAQLVAAGLSPWDAVNLPKAVVFHTFADAKVPLNQSNATLGTYTYANVLAALSYPEWDSRDVSYNYISPVKDQGSCGTCVAFAAAAVAEAAVPAVSGARVNTNDFSEQWLFFCNGMYFPDCTSGWYASEAADVIVSKNIPYEYNYPYLDGPGCTLSSPPESRPGGTFSQTTYTDINLAKEHIRTYGSVMTYFAVYTDFFSWDFSSGPYVWDGVSELTGYHEVQTIGYSDSGSYWVAKNSWGTSWGEQGFFRISYDANVGFMSGANDNIIGLTWAPPSCNPITANGYYGDNNRYDGNIAVVKKVRKVLMA
ncbi:hypothetical protein Vafri_16122, partial [Volvox africanus]